MSDVESLYMSIPVSEFENLMETARLLRERIRQVEEQRDAYYRLSTEINAELKQARTVIAGYEWGLSNAASEEHSLGEGSGGE